jgi:hypothetical protein
MMGKLSGTVQCVFDSVSGNIQEEWMKGFVIRSTGFHNPCSVDMNDGVGVGMMIERLKWEIAFIQVDHIM